MAAASCPRSLGLPPTSGTLLLCCRGFFQSVSSAAALQRQRPTQLPRVSLSFLGGCRTPPATLAPLAAAFSLRSLWLPPTPGNPFPLMPRLYSIFFYCCRRPPAPLPPLGRGIFYMFFRAAAHTRQALPLDAAALFLSFSLAADSHRQHFLSWPRLSISPL